MIDDLLNRCRSGDDDAVATLVARYRDRAHDLAAALLGDEHLAEEAVQEAFLTALARLGDLRDPAAFPAWFRQIVRTQCTRIARKRKERPHGDLAEPPSHDLSPLEQAQHDEIRKRVRTAVAALPPVNRQTAEMFYLDERTCADIASELHVPEGTVKRRLHDARHLLRSMLLGCIPPEERKEPARPERILPL